MQTFLRDLRYASRNLRKAPVFAVTAVLTLALGVGATTAIFSCVYGLLIQSLPFRDAGRIVAVSETHPQIKGGIEATYPDFEDWKGQQTSYSEIAAYSTLNPETVSLVMNGRSEQVHRVLASGTFFSVLGISPLVGRTISEQDDVPRNNHVVVLSESLWLRYFGRGSNVVGRNVDLNGSSYTVIGVLPAGAAYPTQGEVWLPLSLLDRETRSSRVYHSVRVLGRLRSGIQLSQAAADLRNIATRLAVAYPATNRNVGVLITPLREQLVGTLRPAIFSLMGAVLLVLLIACTNVASLLMVRATAQRSEIAVRQALGAGRARLFSQSLAQTLLVCLLGAAFGVILAGWALPLLRRALAHTATLDGSMIQSISLSLPILLFATGICTLAAVIFGLLPVLTTSSNLIESLRQGDRRSIGGRNRSHAALVAGEIAVSVVVLFLSILVIRSFQKLLAIDPGFRTDHLLTAEITLPEPRYEDDSPATYQFYERLLTRISQSPGVLSAGSTTVVPLKPSQVMTRFLVEGAAPLTSGTFPAAQIRSVDPGYFRTLGLAVQEGRIFEHKDMENHSISFVVNRAFARQFLANRNTLGANILLGVLSPHPEKIPVIGVVGDAHDLGIDMEPQPELYLPGFGLHEVLLVRSAVDTQTVMRVVRNAVRELDPSQPIYHVQTVGALLSDSMARQQMTAILLGIFSIAALSLAAIGMYGVLSYSVAQRTREIGIRMAVGATRSDVLWHVLSQAGRVTGAGILVGVSAGLVGARLISRLLFDISTVDPLSVSIAIFVLTTAVVMAAIIPAARAATVNPNEALRAE